MRLDGRSHKEWGADVAATLPRRFRARILAQHERDLIDRDASLPPVKQENAAISLANEKLRKTVEGLQSIAVPLDASDADICEHAEKMAKGCADAAQRFSDGMLREQAEDLLAACGGEFDADYARRSVMNAFCVRHEVEPPKGRKMTAQGAMARMGDAGWWRRQLRKLHAKAVEGAAIRLGYVRKGGDCYVSNESLEMRLQQNRRNTAMMERTLMRNEEGQEFTLHDLAARSVANKSIRRGELMTRIAGLEELAKEAGDDGLFVTLTCPSRMHKFKQVGGGVVVENKNNYDGTSPRDAQKYLSKMWSLIRSAFLRQGIYFYGVRIAEPHHDGTPHWHLLLFVEPMRFWDVCEIFKGYGLRDSPDEAGADRHRLEFVRLEGSAAGYVAKYVAKNIDGEHVGKDLFGNDAIQAATRVEAWAAVHGLRQFQQLGGAPVTVWRELRRVDSVPDDSSELIKAAHVACNRAVISPEVAPSEYNPEGEKEKVRAASFADYVRAQGGATIGKDYKIRLAMEEQDGLGRYGEPLGARPVGVVSSDVVKRAVGALGCYVVESVSWLVRSVRHVWERVRGSVLGLGVAAKNSPPWTSVNNCTRQKDEIDRDFQRTAAKNPPPWLFDGGGGCFA